MEREEKEQHYVVQGWSEQPSWSITLILELVHGIAEKQEIDLREELTNFKLMSLPEGKVRILDGAWRQVRLPVLEHCHVGVTELFVQNLHGSRVHHDVMCCHQQPLRGGLSCVLCTQM